MDVEPVKQNRQAGLALGLVFLSGFAALIYQVLWMKQLGLLFGNTSHAASATLASFFAGLAAGSWVLGKRVSTAANPMRIYAWLESAIAVTALLYFVILGLYQSIYPSVYQSVDSAGLRLLIKFVLSLLLVFPPAFCMGGTIPVIGQFMIRQQDAFGRTSALMYGVNTLGAAIGAGLAGFYLPLWIGFNATCAMAIVVSVGIALVAFHLSGTALPVVTLECAPAQAAESIAVQRPSKAWRGNSKKQKRQQGRPAKSKTSEATPPAQVGRRMIVALCFLSGFGVLALEVLWTRMFSQVLENSVYTFAAILVIVLVCLALGAVISSRLAKLGVPPRVVLIWLVLLGAGAITATPYLFMFVTNDMQVIYSPGSWSSYIALIFWKLALTVGPPALLLGMLFPYLMKIEEAHLKAPGLSLGRLATANTIGAILGALACGFLLLDGLGMWQSMQAIALLYLAAALCLPVGRDTRGIGGKIVCLAMVFVNVLALNPQDLPVISVDPQGLDEKIIETWEGSGCTVAVTESDVGLAIKINSHYSLGSTGAYMQEKMQADLPLMVYPKSEEIFFLGVGTGITAGSALDPRHAHVKRVVACELVPEVITAAKKYMTSVGGFDTTGGLFEDPRATVLVEDGRHYLMATDETFDIINADLFVPFRSGAGSLYTREHFERAKQRLTPDGVFVQWLPLYQLTENEFAVIARTMVEVFDQVSLWRHNFQPGDEVVALVGHQKGKPLPASDVGSRADNLYAVYGKEYRDFQRLNLPLNSETILLFYAGNLTASRSLFEDHPVNTDDRPVIEYQAPRSYRLGSDGKPPWFVGADFAEFVAKVQALCPPDKDPLLVNRSPANRHLPLAGSAMHRGRVAEVNGDIQGTRQAWDTFVTEWTAPD